MALLAVFCVAGWLFWLNAKSTMDEIESQSNVVDLGDALNAEQKAQLYDIAKLFKEEYGIELKIHVSAKRLEAPAVSGKTLFFGINPQTRQVEIILPPLVTSALGSDFAAKLSRKHFPEDFSQEAWPSALLHALRDIWDALAALQSSHNLEYRFKINTDQRE